MKHNLNKELFLAVRQRLVLPEMQNCDETVKFTRDSWIERNFNKPSYKDLSDSQKRLAISLINKNQTLEEYRAGLEQKRAGNFASLEQMKTFQYYAICVAVNNADLSGLESEDGTELPESLARDILKRKFSERKIDKPILNYLYQSFVNPMVNKFLAEGNFRKPRTNPNKFNYTTLKSKEAQALINRFRSWAESQFVRQFNESVKINESVSEINEISEFVLYN